MSKKILVMAANGNQGRLLLPKLRDMGFKIRAFRATAGRDDELMRLGATEVVTGDAADRKVLRRAVEGVDTIYHVGPTANPLEREMGMAMVDAARETKCGHLIYSSVMHSIASRMIQHKLKREVEEYLIEANINFTILQPADYMIPLWFRPTFETGVWEQIYDLDRGQAMVDIEDITDAAAKVALEREKHFGATYELAAPGAHTGHGIAAAISATIGRPVEARLITPDDFFARYYGMGSGDTFRYQYALIRSVALWMTQYDFLGNPNVAGWVLGRPPTTLEAFLAREWARYKSDKAAGKA